MAEVLLSGGQVMLVDEADTHLFSNACWFIQRVGKNHAYAVSGSMKSGRILAHRVITGAAAGLVVDHINGNGLDNRRANLRVCTFAENLRNRRPFKGGKSRFKGLSRNRHNTRWLASIGSNSGGITKRVRLGSFLTEEEAASAYDIAAVLLYGEFAHLNFPHVFPEVPSRGA